MTVTTTTKAFETNLLQRLSLRLASIVPTASGMVEVFLRLLPLSHINGVFALFNPELVLFFLFGGGGNLPFVPFNNIL